MVLIDFILNLAALLLWLNWRSARFDPLVKYSAASLLGTLKRAEPRGRSRRKYLIALIALLFGRAVIYRLIGPAVDWTPGIQLGAIVVPFRSEILSRMVLYSILSFAGMLAVFYLSLLLLSLVNQRVPDTEPMQKLVRLQLGWIERWPFVFKLFLPLVAAVLIWLVLSPLLARLEIVPHTKTGSRIFGQGLLIGAGTYLTWKYVIVGTLLLYLLNSYIYLGKHPLWNFVNLTTRQLLAPLRPLPLRVGRMDFAPVVGIAVVFLASEFVSRWLPGFFRL